MKNEPCLDTRYSLLQSETTKKLTLAYVNVLRKKLLRYTQRVSLLFLSSAPKGRLIQLPYSARFRYSRWDYTVRQRLGSKSLRLQLKSYACYRSRFKKLIKKRALSRRRKRRRKRLRYQQLLNVPRVYSKRLAVQKTRRKLRIRARKVLGLNRRSFFLLGRRMRSYQRRRYLKNQQAHLNSDFQQTRFHPDHGRTPKTPLFLKNTLFTQLSGTVQQKKRIPTQYTTLTNSLFRFKSVSFYSHPQLLLYTILNPFLLKLVLFEINPYLEAPKQLSTNMRPNQIKYTQGSVNNFINVLYGILHKSHPLINSLPPKYLTTHSNLIPNKILSTTVTKYLSSLHLNNKIREDFVPIYFHTLVRFVESATGKRFILQFYPFLHQNIPIMTLVRYKQWIPKMKMYERRLGHKFFFEESLHLMHLSFALRDSVLFSS